MIKPFPLIAITTVEIKVIKPISAAFQSKTPLSPILPTAIPASESPIIIIIGPITTGGSNLWSHFVPTK